ncbi:hypothetical protein HQ590_08785 [bacterium]|nr:hypothetical protein [bacterium]
MKPAARLERVTPHLYRWSSLHPQWKITFSSFALVTPDGVALVDPIKPSPAALKKIQALGRPLGIFLTSANHDRDADWFRRQFAVQIYAHEKARSGCDTKLDVLVLDNEKLPGGLRVVALPGAGAGEIGLVSKLDGGLVILGDLLFNPQEGGLAFLPEQYCEDGKQTRRSARRLLDLNFRTLVVSHGEPLTTNAKRQVAAFLKRRRRRRTTK